MESLVGTLEPLSIKDDAIAINVSLRGTLAQQLMELQGEDDPELVHKFIQSLITSLDPDLAKFHQGTTLVIGRLSERGQFFPDW